MVSLPSLYYAETLKHRFFLGLSAVFSPLQLHIGLIPLKKRHKMLEGAFIAIGKRIGVKEFGVPLESN